MWPQQLQGTVKLVRLFLAGSALLIRECFGKVLQGDSLTIPFQGKPTTLHLHGPVPNSQAELCLRISWGVFRAGHAALQMS